MKSLLICVSLLLTLSLSKVGAKNEGGLSVNTYNVMFHSPITNSEVSSHMKEMSESTSNFVVLSEWKIGENFRGYAAKMDEEGRLKSLATSVVSFVEPNFGTEIHQCDVSQAGATWGLVRTTVRDWASPNPTEYNYTSTAGTGVDIYVLDSGIEVTVGYFEGRATGGADFIENPPNPGDPNGHGTHIAGTIMAQSYGLARNATAISVRIVGASGAGSVQNMIDGINWVAQQASLSGKKSVMNLAVGGSQSDIVDSAVNACVEAGVHVLEAATLLRAPPPQQMRRRQSRWQPVIHLMDLPSSATMASVWTL